MAFYPTASGGSPYARLAAMGGIGAGANGGGTGIQLGAPQYSGPQFANSQSDAGPAFDPNSMWWGDPQGYKNYLGGERQKATAMQTYERLGGNGSGGPGSTSAQPWLDPSSPWYGNMEAYQANAQKSPWLDSTSQWYGNEAGFRASQAADYRWCERVRRAEPGDPRPARSPGDGPVPRSVGVPGRGDEPDGRTRHGHR